MAFAQWVNPAATATGYPAGYTDTATDQAGIGALASAIASARKQTTAASENPGVFTLTGVGPWQDASTVAIAGGAHIPVGSDVHEIIPPGDTMAFVGTLDDAYARSIRPVRNEPGSGQFTINRHSPNATAAILQPGNLVKVCYPEIDPGYIFAWFMEQGNFGLVSSNEEGGEEITIGGRGALSYWDRAIWLASKFTIPWWPATMATPPAGTKGSVIVVAGTYRHYTIAGGVITGYANFTTAGFSAYYDTSQTYDWPSAGSKRYLVHLTTTEDPSSPSYVGYYFHPHQDGVTETRASFATGTTSTVLLSDISADKPGAILYRLFQEGTDLRPPDPADPADDDRLHRDHRQQRQRLGDDGRAGRLDSRTQRDVPRHDRQAAFDRRHRCRDGAEPRLPRVQLARPDADEHDVRRRQGPLRQGRQHRRRAAPRAERQPGRHVRSGHRHRWRHLNRRAPGRCDTCRS